MRLMNAIVVGRVEGPAGRCRKVRRRSERVVRKRERLGRVDEAFLHERSIDRQTYERHRDQLREQVALAEIGCVTRSLGQSRHRRCVLAFAGKPSRRNSCAPWMELSLDSETAGLQQVLFPCGGRGNGVPTGIRTRVLALKGPRPGPLDDGDKRQDQEPEIITYAASGDLRRRPPSRPQPAVLNVRPDIARRLLQRQRRRSAPDEHARGDRALFRFAGRHERAPRPAARDTSPTA